MITVKTTGGWGTFAGTISQANKNIARSANKAVKKLADDAHTHLIEDILLQKLTLAPLSPLYAATKPPGRPILVNTQEYVLQVGVLRDEGGYRLGLKRGARTKNIDSSHTPRKKGRWKGKSNKQASLEQVATYLEFGTSRMPPRPHWRPTEVWAKTQVGDRGLDVLKDVFKI